MGLFDFFTMGRKKTREDKYRNAQSERARQVARSKKREIYPPYSIRGATMSGVIHDEVVPFDGVLTLDRVNELMQAIIQQNGGEIPPTMPLDQNSYLSISDPSGQHSRAFKMGLAPYNITAGSMITGVMGSSSIDAWNDMLGGIHRVELNYSYERDGMRLTPYYDGSARRVFFAYAYPNGGHASPHQFRDGVNKQDTIYIQTSDTAQWIGFAVSSLPVWTPPVTK